MSAERDRTPDDGAPVRNRRRLAAEQPVSPEECAAAEDCAAAGDAARLGGEHPGEQPTTASPDDDLPALAPIHRADTDTDRIHPATRFPQDPAAPSPRHPRRRLRGRQSLPHLASVTAVWQRSQEEHRRFATRFAGQLLIIGASLGAFLTLVLGVRQGIFSVGWFVVMGACAVAAVWGLVYVLLPRPAPDPVLRATPAGAALLITLALSLNHSNAVDGMLLLSWPLLFAAYLLPRRTAYWTLGIVMACLTVILAAGSGPGRFPAWVETTTSMALTLVVIRRVRDQAERLRQALAEQASTDPLTGLSNRRAFDEALEREVSRQRRTRAPLSLLAVDVDHFKKINDTWGHAAGDDTLAALGSLLPRLVRASDIVSRVGGEEFGILLPDCPAPQARARADALRAAVWATSRDWPHPVTVSVGVATLPDSADALNDLVVAADRALYAAKESGRDRVRVAPTRPTRPTMPREDRQ